MQVQGIRDNENLTYKSAVDRGEFLSYCKAVGIPSAVLFLSFGMIMVFGSYGRLLLAPMVCIMWGVGVACAMFLPSHRKSIMTETMTTISVYLAALYVLKVVIGMLSGMSASTLAASLSISMSETSNNTGMGWLQNMLTIGAVGTPVGFVGLQAQRLFKLRRNANKVKAMKQLRNMRDTNKNYQ